MDEIDFLLDALHMLHEQAHGEVPFRTCNVEPCLSVRQTFAVPAGPAQLSLVGLPR